VHEINLLLDNSYNFHIISARKNTVSCLYRPPDDEQLFVRNMSRVI